MQNILDDMDGGIGADGALAISISASGENNQVGHESGTKERDGHSLDSPVGLASGARSSWNLRPRSIFPKFFPYSDKFFKTRNNDE